MLCYPNFCPVEELLDEEAKDLAMGSVSNFGGRLLQWEVELPFGMNPEDVPASHHARASIVAEKRTPYDGKAGQERNLVAWPLSPSDGDCVLAHYQPDSYAEPLPRVVA
jgi:hypothetical protein